MELWPVSSQRAVALAEVSAAVPPPGASPLLIAIDGVDGAGKSVFADQLARVLMDQGRTVVRASVDDFHRTRAERYRRGRASPEGFWLDSYDYHQLRTVLLDPLSLGGSRSYRTAVHDLVTDQPVHQPVRHCQPDAVLVLDGIFLHRDELRAYWDFSVWLDAPFDVTAARMAARDGTSPDADDPNAARYRDGQRLYLSQCRPATHASIVIDNTNPDTPFRRRDTL